MKSYVVYGEESGEIKEFKTLKEAQEFIKMLKLYDKKNRIKDKYYIEEEEW
jgi:hypothetical protein